MVDRTVRHKLVDHGRRTAREERLLRLLDVAPIEDPWDVKVDVSVARDVLGNRAHHRLVPVGLGGRVGRRPRHQVTLSVPAPGC